MKKPAIFKMTAAIALCTAVAASCVLAGCAQDTAEDSQYSKDTNIVSYVSIQTQVYSTTAEVVEAVADSVVEISTEATMTQWGMQYIVSGAGSGVIVGQDEDTYYIVTNDHVIEGANDITVRLRNGEEYEAELVAADDAADIAAITITCGEQLEIAVWADSDELQIGEDLIAIGNPLGSLGGTVTKGILSATERSIVVNDYEMTLLQTDTAINPGNSGGGLFNMRGELVGIVNAKTSDEEVEGICFAIPANTARDTFSDLVTYGYVQGRATFDIELTEGSISSGIGGAAQSITYVTATGDGVDAGTFELYDRIYKINGTFYIFLSEWMSDENGRKLDRRQVALRSGNIYGPYEKRILLEKGNGTDRSCCQGSLLQAPDSSWWSSGSTRATGMRCPLTMLNLILESF